MKTSFWFALQKRAYGLCLMLALLAFSSLGFALKPESSTATVTPTLSSTATSEPAPLSLKDTVGKGFVHALAWAPDGKSYALAGAESVDLYDAVSNQVTATLPVGFSAQTLQYSPDGHLLAMVTGSASIVVWDIAASSPIYGLNGNVFSFSKDGKTLAFVHAGDVSLVDALTGKVKGTLSGYDGSLGRFAFNQAGNLLLAASTEKVFLADLSAGKLVASLDAPWDEAIRVVSFNKDDSTVLVVDDTAIHSWNPTTNTTDDVYSIGGARLYAVAFNPAKELALLVVDNEIRVWSMATHAVTSKFSVESDGNIALALSPDASKLLTLNSTSGFARLWDLSVPNPTSTTFNQYPLHASQAVFSPTAQLMFSFSASGTIDATDVMTGKKRYSIYQASQPFFISPDGRFLAYKQDEGSSQKGTVKIYDAMTGKALYTLVDSASYEKGWIAFSRDGKLLAYIKGYDYSLVLVDMTTGTALSSSVKCDDVNGMTFGPDGNSLAYGGRTSSSCDLGVYDISSGKSTIDFDVAEIQNANWAFQQLLYNADGSRLLALDPDLMLFDAKSGERLCDLKNIQRAFFSPDGRYIAAIDSNHQDIGDFYRVLILDANTGQTLFILQTAQNKINDLAFSPDGQLLALTGTGTELWAALTGQPLSHQPYAALALAFNQTGDGLSLFTNKSTIQHWQIANLPKIIAASPTPPTTVSTPTARPTVVLSPQATQTTTAIELKKSLSLPIQYSPDGKTVFFQDGSMVKWFDASSGAKLGEHDTGLLPARFILSPNGKLLLFEGIAGAGVMDVQTQKDIGSIYVEYHRASGYVFSKDSQYVAYVADSEALDRPLYTLYVWSVVTGKNIGDEQYFQTLFPESHSTLSQPAISPNGKLVAVGHTDKRVYVWDLLTGKTRFILEGHASVVEAVDFSPNGSTLASASDDGTIRFWNMATGKLDHVLSGLFADDIVGMHYASDGKSLTVSVRNQSDRVINLQSRALSSPNTEITPSAFALQRYREGYFTDAQSIFSKLLFSPDNKLLAIADRHVLLLDSATQKPLKLLVNSRGDSIRGITFSPDAKQVAVTSASGYVTVWDVASEKSIFSQKSVFLDGGTADRRTGDINPGLARGATYFINNLAEQGLSFSPDGRLLAFGNKNTIELWDVAAAKKISTLANADGLYATQVSFSADGKHLYAILNRNHAAQIWDVETGKLIRPVELPPVNPDSYTAIALNGPLFARNNSQPGQGAWVELWNLETGEMRRLLGVASDKNEPLRFSPDGTLLRSVGDRHLYYWKTSTGQLLYTENYAISSAFAISPDNRLLAKHDPGYLGEIILSDISSFSQQGDSEPAPTATPQVFTMPPGTPVPQAGVSVISSENATQLRELSRFGNGTTDQVFWAAKGDSVVVTGSLGLDVYPFNPAAGSAGEATHTDRPGWSHSSALTSDGRLVSAGVVDGHILVTDISSGETLADLLGSGPAILSADGSLVAYLVPDLSASNGIVEAYGPQNMLAVWNIVTHTSVLLQPGYSQYLGSPIFSPDGKWLAALQSQGQYQHNNAIRVWDTSTGAIVNAFAVPYYANISSMSFSPDGRYMTGTAGGSAWVWDMRPGGPASQFEIYKGEPDFIWLAYQHLVVASALSPDNSSLAVATDENSLALYSRTSRQKLRDFTGNTSPIRHLRFSPNGKILLSVDADGVIAFWNVSNGKLLTSIDRHLAEVGGFVFRRDGALSVWGVGTDRVIAPKDAALLHTTRIAKGRILAASPQGDLLTAYDPFQMSLWDAVTGDFKQTLEGEATVRDPGSGTGELRTFAGAAFTSNGKHLFTAGAGGVWVYDTADGKLLNQFDLGVLRKFHLSADAKLFSLFRYEYMSWNGRKDTNVPFFVHTAHDVESLWSNDNPQDASDIVFSPAGRWVGVVGSKLVLYTAQGQLVDELVLGETKPGVTAAFNPADSVIAVGRTDGSILLIKLDGLEVLAIIKGHRGPVTHLAFSADGLYLASAGADGTVRFWSVP